MKSVPTKQTPPPLDWSFLVTWVGANIGGWLVGWLAIWPLVLGLSLTGLAFERGWDIALIVRLESVVLTLISGAVMGVAQGLVLRKRLSVPLGWWVLVTTLGWLLPHIPGTLLGGEQMGVALALGLIASLLSGVAVGLLQWLVLQAFLPRAGWWIVANSVGWFVCWIFTPLAITLSAIATGLVILWLQDKAGSKDGSITPSPSADPAENEPAWLQAIKAGQPLSTQKQPQTEAEVGWFARRPSLKQSVTIWRQAIFPPRLATFHSFPN